MKSIWVGCGQLTWPRITSREQVLEEIAQAGYDGAPASPSTGTPEEVLALYARYGLKPAPGYLSGNFWKAEEQEIILQRAKEQAEFMRAVGCTELYLGPGGFDGYVTSRGLTRRQIAGHVRVGDMMTDTEFAQFVDTVNKIGEITLKYGVRSCFHNHVGSVIETRAEIDKLFALVDRSVVFQGPDIGHLVWAGADPVQFCMDYAQDIFSLHVKDIDENVLTEGVTQAWDYGTFSARGIFTELGEGCVDFPALFEVLHIAGYTGWVIVETDVTQKPTALESAIISRKYLQSLGY
jgi:inosose dehydratase